MDIQDYLNRVKAELKGISKQEKSDLIEEISAHLSEGHNDTNLGANESDRLKHLDTEMGNPTDLGRRLREIHNPSITWVAYLLIVLPDLILFPFLSLIAAVLIRQPEAFMHISIRITILAKMGLLVCAYFLYKRYGSPANFLFWISSVWLTLLALYLREGHWRLLGNINVSMAEKTESIFWGLLLIILLIWLFKSLWTTKDAIWIVFASLPFLTALGNLISSQMLISGSLSQGYTLPNWRLGWFSLSQLIIPIWAALFLFSKQRLFRWLALFISIIPIGSMNLVASVHYPYLFVLWWMPFLLVGISCFMEVFHFKSKTGG